MNLAVKWGLILGVVVALMGFAFGFAGLHTSPMVALVFVGLAVAINIVVVILALRQAKDSATWVQQLINGVVIGVVGAILIFAGSYLMTGVLIPDYYDNMRDGYFEFFNAANMTEEQIDVQMQKLEGATPVSGAMQGAIGTVIMSILVAAIGGIFLRKK